MEFHLNDMWPEYDLENRIETPKGKVTGQGSTVRLHLYSPNCSRNFQQQKWFPNTVGKLQQSQQLDTPGPQGTVCINPQAKAQDQSQ